MKRTIMYLSIPLMLVLTMVLTAFNGNGQTVLINGAAEGGFELGATPTANGWTEVNSIQSFFVGSAPVAATGTNCAYTSISNVFSQAYYLCCFKKLNEGFFDFRAGFPGQKLDLSDHRKNGAIL